MPDNDAADNTNANNPRPALGEVLSARELALLAAHLFDNVTQVVLARARRVDQSTIHRRLAKAVKKLQDAGYPIRLKGRGNRRKRVSYVDPDALGRLTTDGSDESNRTRGRWAKGRKVDRKE